MSQSTHENLILSRHMDEKTNMSDDEEGRRTPETTKDGSAKLIPTNPEFAGKSNESIHSSGYNATVGTTMTYTPNERKVKNLRSDY